MEQISSNRTNKNNTIITVAICITITVVAIVLAVIFTKAFRDDKRIEETTISTNDTINFTFEEIGELATYENNFTKVNSFENFKQLFGLDLPITKNSFIYSYDGTIKAGIDFNDVKYDVDEARKMITITVPETKILSAEIFPESFKVYNEQDNIFNPISIEDMNDSIKQMLDDAKAEAIEKGLLKEAEKNARVLLRNMVQNSLPDGYSVTFL